METSSQVRRPAQGQNESVDIRAIISFVWRLRLWIVLSVVLCLAAAYVFVYMQTPMYQRTAKVLIATKTSSNSELKMLYDITGVAQTSSIDNEIFIFKSPNLMKSVVEDLDLNVRYYNKYIPHFSEFGTADGRQTFLSRAYDFINEKLSVKTIEYYNDSPFSISVIADPLYPEEALPKSLRFAFTSIDKSSYVLKDAMAASEPIQFEGNLVRNYDDTLSFRGFSLVISAKNSPAPKPGGRYIATWTDPERCAVAYSERLVAKLAEGAKSKFNTPDVILLSMDDSKPKRAEDILNTLIFEYNRESVEYKNLSVIKTIEFIDNRLAVISDELRNVESNYRSYQSNRALVNIEAQSQIALTSDMNNENKLSEIDLQSSILSMIKESLSDRNSGEFKVIPSNIGLSDANLGSVINVYNEMLSERNRLLSNSSQNNPRVKSLNQQLHDTRNNIILSIDNLEKVYRIRESEIRGSLKKTKSRMSAIPVQQFDLTQIERKQQIIEPLYLLLQQKKEEAQISMYSVTENARVIDVARGSELPIAPQRSKIFLLAFLLGLCIPPAIVWLVGLLRSKVLTRSDIEAVFDVPVIANIPKTDDVSVEWNSSARDIRSESFRMLRSNLQFLGGNVLQVTSSSPAEGKSFVASNLAVSIAHTGKRVALVGMDLRKPVLKDLFSDVTFHPDKSVVGYLIGKCDSVADMANHVGSHPNLSVILSGAVPPNPSELLATDRLGTLIDLLRQEYDYVIIDSAPMLPVSDSLYVNKHVDCTLYVVRSGVTPLQVLPEIRILFEQSGVRSPKFILNGVDVKSKYMKYGYGSYGYGYGGSGYGYGGGYGYGYGYGGSESSGKVGKGRRHHRKAEKSDNGKPDGNDSAESASKSGMKEEA